MFPSFLTYDERSDLLETKTAIICNTPSYYRDTFNHLPVTASAFNFSVTPITSENQIDKRKTYFDLQLVPDQEVELKAELRNDTEKK